MSSDACACAPVIETERLILRPHRLEDYPACVAMWSDPKVVRFIGGQLSTPQRTWMRLLAYPGHWQLMGFGYWAIEEKAGGSFAGELGFADFKRGTGSAMDGVPELGWALAPAFHGKGYATEAVRAAVAWGDEHLESRRTVCMIDSQNTASIRVAQKCGYAQFEEATLEGGKTLFFQRTNAASR